MTDFDAQKKIQKICLRLLTRREHSQQELLDKLVIKGFDRTETQIVIDDLIAHGWQSDQRFAESYTRYRIKTGIGPVKITYELQQRGITEFDLEDCLFELAESWFEIIERVYQKKFADDTLLINKEWLKRFRFLQQRGFSSEMIKTLFKKLKLQIIYI